MSASSPWTSPPAGSSSRRRGSVLSALWSQGPAGVPVTLTLGETSFTTTVDFEHRRGGWSFGAPKRGFVFHPPPGPGGGGPPPPPPPPPPPAKLAFRVLGTGQYSSLTIPTNTVARTAAEYQALWQKTGSGGSPPYVSFQTELVVGIFIGGRSTGGYGVKVLSATPQGAGARIDYEEIQPGWNCMVPQVLTSPWIVVAVQRVPGAVTFSGKVRVVNCP